MAGAFILFMVQIRGKKTFAVPAMEIIGFLQQKPMVISRNPIGIDLQMGMDQRTACRRQVVLGDGHVDGFRIVMKNCFQIAGRQVRMQLRGF
jgi:hypothetical protein